MANLFVGTQYYISDVYSDGDSYVVNTHLLDSEGSYTQTKAYGFLKGGLIPDTPSVGAVQELSLISKSETGATTATGSAPESTTGSGSGLTLNWSGSVSLDNDNSGVFTINNRGTGYAVGDTVTFANDTFTGFNTNHEKVKLSVKVIDESDLFPTGLSDASVVANALPVINVLISTSSE